MGPPAQAQLSTPEPEKGGVSRGVWIQENLASSCEVRMPRPLTSPSQDGWGLDQDKGLEPWEPLGWRVVPR